MPVRHLYFVVSGEFCLEKQLPKSGQNNMLTLLETRTKEYNTLARKFKEIKDFPFKHKLQIYGCGSMLGDEDVCFERSTYSCSVKCVSETGTVYALDADNFRAAKTDPEIWTQFCLNARAKEEKRIGKNIRSSPKRLQLTEDDIPRQEAPSSPRQPAPLMLNKTST